MTFDINYRVDPTFRWLGSDPIPNAELTLTVCGIERCKPDKFYGPTVRDDYHVHFILSGKGTLEIGEKKYHLKRGDIFTIPPYIETYYYADSTDPWQYTWVSFSGTRAAYFLEKAGITPTNPTRATYINPEDFLTLTEKILNHHELTISNELIRTATLYEILALLVSSHNQQLADNHKTLRPDYSADFYVKHAIEYIHNNYNQVKVNDIAEFIGITRSYLTHIFKQRLNVSPQEYLLTYRLEEGCRLLRMTNLSIQEIGIKIGYDNQLNFSKIFKKKYGISPKNYRLKNQNILQDTKPAT